MKARSDESREVSLLSYLSGIKNSPPVGLSLTSVNPPAPDRSAPFNILYDSDPLTRVAEGSFVTDAGCELKKVFLLLQKDRYDLARDELWPLTNGDIDDAWQRAFALHGGEADDASRILLAGQTGDSGLPNPFSSLFYCKTRRLFFHPPCPQCGQPLRLCRDDDLLLSSGLRPYSASTKRYLHCVSCSTQSTNAFYVRDRGNDDPEAVRDLGALIDSFSLLREGSDPAGDFPCISCPDHDICYGNGRAAHTRIVPFSFFPFYFLIFDSMSLPALDFLPLISGASSAELKNALAAKGEQGRIKCLERLQRDGLTGVPLFPVQDERYFLEVLYLKLSFLGDLLRQVFPHQGIAGHPEMRLTIDRIWVRLPGQSGFLPSFWNFTTKYLDIVTLPEITHVFPEASSSILLHAGLLWFHALLVNNGRSSRELILSLKEMISGNDTLPEIPPPLLSNPEFAPEQIFWDPRGRRVNHQWLPLWEQTLEIGFALLQSAIHPGQQWSPVNFFTEFENLRTGVRAAMFRGFPVPEDVPVRVDPPAGDEIIHEIITGIIGKWRDRETAVPLPQKPADESGMTETIVFTPAEIAAPVSPVSDEEEWTETVVLSARGATTTALPPFFPRDPGKEAVLETVALAAGGVKTETATTAPPNEGEDTVLETVIMSPGVRPGGTSGVRNDSGAGPAGDGIEEAANGDALPETVILNPQKAKVRTKEWKD